MRFYPFTIVRHFLTVTVPFLVLAALPAQAIIDFAGVPPAETPKILNGFESQLKAYIKKYPEEGQAGNPQGSLKHFGFSFEETAPAVLREIALAEIALGRGHEINRLYQEFKKIQADIVKRGFEPSQDQDFAPPQDLIIYYGRGTSGPTVDVEDKIQSFVHGFDFQLRLNYQPKNHRIQQHEFYPQAMLSGSVWLRCKNKFDTCSIASSSFDKASIRWELMPGTKGGNSSAGGSSNFTSLDEPILKQTEIDQIMNAGSGK